MTRTQTRFRSAAVGAIAGVAAVASAPVQIEPPAPATPEPLVGQPMTIADKSIDLGLAFPDNAAGRTFQARHVELAPGQTLTTSSAVGRPGIGYVTVGEVVERRADGALRTIGVGGTSFDRGGEVAAFVNESRAPAIVVFVDLSAAPVR